MRDWPEHLAVELAADGEERSFPGTFTVLWDGHRRPIGAIGIWSERRGDEEPFSSIEPLR
jgi:hypothetical protein